MQDIQYLSGNVCLKIMHKCLLPLHWAYKRHIARDCNKKLHSHTCQCKKLDFDKNYGNYDKVVLMLLCS